ncbi:MAG: response regulator, partial [Pseudomonadales bacterium]|nr:response regulator [Pseudomonadales bacterium]
HRKPAADILRTPAVLQEDSLVWLSHRLLVAEDNDVNQLVISRMLKKLGLSFDLVNNGARALDAVSSNPDKYDLILMDCEMPEMDGYEASLRIRQFEEDNRLKPLPILALTAHVLDSHREKVIEKGMNDHISKPVSLEMLKIKLEEYLPVAARLSDQSDLLVRGDPRL